MFFRANMYFTVLANLENYLTSIQAHQTQKAVIDLVEHTLSKECHVIIFFGYHKPKYEASFLVVNRDFPRLYYVH